MIIVLYPQDLRDSRSIGRKGLTSRKEWEELELRDFKTLTFDTVCKADLVVYEQGSYQKCFKDRNFPGIKADVFPEE